MRLREEILRPEKTPVYLRGELTSRFLYLMGRTQDHLVQMAYEGISARYPTFAGPNARLELGHDRRIPILESEPVPSQIKRLKQWRSTHRLAGTNKGVLQNVQPFWYPEAPRIRLVQGNSQRALWATMDPDGAVSFVRREPSNWDWDSTWFGAPEPATIHRWFPIVYAPTYVEEHGTAENPSETISFGSSLTSRRCADFANLARQFRRAGSFLWGWILAFDPASFDPNGGPGAGYPDGTWWKAYNAAGFNRLQPARYHELHPPIGVL